MTRASLNTQHLPAPAAAQLDQVARLTRAPLSASVRARLRRDVARDKIAACAKRKSLDLDPHSLMAEANTGAQHFELGCWLHYYSRRVGDEGLWARIDCMRRLLLSDYHQFNPRYDFFTVFDFGEREFDACFEMGDGSDVLRALVGMRSSTLVAEKFAQMGWTEEYLQGRGYLDCTPAQLPAATAARVHGQADLFAAA
ncbi:hypothetical protein ACG02S_24535 [Roseateles sp. DC23W]|uniref:Uncharacterized protein n=2 Tax=Pelomonas dachongensis TaxID=3299029 RepID=A0ABW7EWT8_9BURK